MRNRSRDATRGVLWLKWRASRVRSNSFLPKSWQHYGNGLQSLTPKYGTVSLKPTSRRANLTPWLNVPCGTTLPDGLRGCESLRRSGFLGMLSTSSRYGKRGCRQGICAAQDRPPTSFASLQEGRQVLVRTRGSASPRRWQAGFRRRALVLDRH